MGLKKYCTHCKTPFPATTAFFPPRPKTASKDGLYSWCRDCTRQASRTWRENNPDKVAQKNASMGKITRQYRKNLPGYDSSNRKARYLRYRADALHHYGEGDPKCVCCGETEPKFLAFDHIEGGGNQHRKTIPSGMGFFTWLQKNGYPPMFQLLCHNCNLAKGFYGACPHQSKA